ncbi:MAG: hypothetical protein CVU81_02695 [Euryarchaeota archaeon HGW-Euryarchaeota-1]|nr:MAG: hypothetical protein CVU81_02695 [Euryarchaeota archaeon HGW-Euryarchaeota-1]
MAEREKIILYTGVQCPRCPRARAILRDFAKANGLKESIDFVEKTIGGEDKAVFFEALQRQIASVPAIYYKGVVVFGDEICEEKLKKLFEK